MRNEEESAGPGVRERAWKRDRGSVRCAGRKAGAAGERHAGRAFEEARGSGLESLCWENIPGGGTSPTPH